MFNVSNFLGSLIQQTKGGDLKVPLDVNQLRQTFMKHDANGDGLLDWYELKAAFKELGEIWLVWTADRALVYADENDDGVIDEKEMAKLIAFALKRNYYPK